jgi:hypothetical protein
MIEEQELVTCTSCKHYYRTWSDKFFRTDPMYAKCKQSTKTKSKFDIVTGKTNIETEIKYCSTQRRGDCGEGGQYWTPKNDKDLFKLIKRV